MQEHLQGTAGRVCPEDAENLLSVRRCGSQQAHLQRHHMLSLCRPVRSSDSSESEASPPPQDIERTSNLLNKKQKKKGGAPFFLCNLCSSFLVSCSLRRNINQCRKDNILRLVRYKR